MYLLKKQLYGHSRIFLQHPLIGFTILQLSDNSFVKACAKKFRQDFDQKVFFCFVIIYLLFS